MKISVKRLSVLFITLVFSVSLSCKLPLAEADMSEVQKNDTSLSDSERYSDAVTKGRYWKEQKNYPEAILSFEEALAISPEEEVFTELATCYGGIKEYDKAASMLVNGVEHYPESVELHSLAALMYSVAENHEKTIEYATKALELNSIKNSSLLNTKENLMKQLLLHRMRGYAYLSLNKPKEAIEDYDFFLEKIPDGKEVLEERGKAEKMLK